MDRAHGDFSRRQDERRGFRPPPRLLIVLELEDDPRAFLEAHTFEDEQRLLLALHGGALEELRALVDDLDAYVRREAA